MAIEPYPYEAKRRVVALIESLELMAVKDTEQEVRGIAVPVLKATLAYLKTITPEDPVVQSLIEPYLWEAEGDDPVRVVDALLVARQFDAAIGPYPLVVG